MLGVAAVVAGSPAAAAGGALGIPPVVFSAYVAAETNAPSIADRLCGRLADHRRHLEGRIQPRHHRWPHRRPRRAGHPAPLRDHPRRLDSPAPPSIPDTDDGLLDGDPTWDRAVGPAQFLPGSWRAFGQDGNDDGTADPQNVFDAALGTVAHLCLTAPGDYTNPTDLAAALRRYNNSAEYVATVTGWIDYYRAFHFTQGAVTADGALRLPPPRRLGHRRPDPPHPPRLPRLRPRRTRRHPRLRRPPRHRHQRLRAMSDTCRCGWGVTITGLDNHRYTYCHGTQVIVQAGADVTAGQLIMTSGNTGNSEAPHLHFQIRNPDGALLCPQHRSKPGGTASGSAPPPHPPAAAPTERNHR